MTDVLHYGVTDEDGNPLKCVGWNVTAGNSDPHGDFSARVKNGVFQGKSVVYLEQNVRCHESEEAMKHEVNRRYDADIHDLYDRHHTAYMANAQSEETKKLKFKQSLLENRKSAELAVLNEKIQQHKADNMKKVVSAAVLPVEVSDLRAHISVDVKGGATKCPTCIANEATIAAHAAAVPPPAGAAVLAPPVHPVPYPDQDPVVVHVQFFTKASLAKGASS